MTDNMFTFKKAVDKLNLMDFIHYMNDAASAPIILVIDVSNSSDYGNNEKLIKTLQEKAVVPNAVQVILWSDGPVRTQPLRLTNAASYVYGGNNDFCRLPTFIEHRFGDYGPQGVDIYGSFVLVTSNPLNPSTSCSYANLYREFHKHPELTKKIFYTGKGNFYDESLYNGLDEFQSLFEVDKLDL